HGWIRWLPGGRTSRSLAGGARCFCPSVSDRDSECSVLPALRQEPPGEGVRPGRNRGGGWSDCWSGLHPWQAVIDGSALSFNCGCHFRATQLQKNQNPGATSNSCRGSCGSSAFQRLGL